MYYNIETVYENLQSHVNFFPKSTVFLFHATAWAFVKSPLLSLKADSENEKCFQVYQSYYEPDLKQNRQISRKMIVQHLGKLVHLHIPPLKLWAWMHFVRVDICVCAGACVWLFNSVFSSHVLTAASGDGELDMFLRKGRRQGAITLLFSPHNFFSFLVLLLHSAPLLRWRCKCFRQMSATSCLKPSTRAAELGKL